MEMIFLDLFKSIIIGFGFTIGLIVAFIIFNLLDEWYFETRRKKEKKSFEFTVQPLVQVPMKVNGDLEVTGDVRVGGTVTGLNSKDK